MTVEIDAMPVRQYFKRLYPILPKHPQNVFSSLSFYRAALRPML